MKIFSDKKKEQLKKDFTAFLANIRNEESAVVSFFFSFERQNSAKRSFIQSQQDGVSEMLTNRPKQIRILKISAFK